MRTKILLLVFSVLLSHHVSATETESPLTGSLSKLFTWITSLDDVIKKIDNKENLAKVNRLLGDVSSDLLTINSQKINLQELIPLSRNSRQNYTKIQDKCKTLFNALHALVFDLNNLKQLVNQTSEHGFEKSLDEIKTATSTNEHTWRFVASSLKYYSTNDSTKHRIETDVDKSIALNKDIYDRIQKIRTSIQAKL